MNDIVLYILFAMFSTAILLGLYRLLKGPSGADRAVALDALTNITAALLVVLALVFERYLYLDVALVYAILSFVGVIAVARYLEGGL